MQNGRLDHARKIFSKSNWVYIDKLCNGDTGFVSPILTLDLTVKCNYQCAYCIDQNIVNRVESTEEIPWDILCNLLYEMRQEGCCMIEITGGGEPTLYTRFGDFISYAVQLGYHLALVTNGSLLKKYETLLMTSPIDWIRISLDAAHPETHSRLHGIGTDMFNEILSSAEKLARAQVVGISFVVTEENVVEMADAAIIANRIGASYIEFKPLMDQHDNTTYPYNDTVKSRIRQQMDLLIAMNGKTKVIYPKSFAQVLGSSKPQQKDYTVCKACYLRTVLTSQGIYPCSYYRGMVRPKPLPSDTTVLRTYRNEAIEEIHSNIMCNHYCARHDINRLIYDLSQIRRDFPDVYRQIGWPVDHGQDVRWI